MENIVSIKVIGIGGAGNNVIDRMICAGVQGVSYVAINTDANAIRISQAENKMQIGEKLTNGLGTGSDEELGRKAAEDAAPKIEALLKGTDMVFITAGMGGGCGTGAAPVVAQIAKNMGILTVAVVTKPFSFEGRGRMKAAEAGIEELSRFVDAILIIPNNNLKHATDSKITFINAFAIADGVLLQTVVSIIDLVQSTAEINLDFADMTTVIQNSGRMHVGLGRASGADRVQKIYESIRQSKLLDTSIEGARSVLLSVAGSAKVGLDEVETLAAAVQELVHPDANIILGLRLDKSESDELQALIIATGIA